MAASANTKAASANAKPRAAVVVRHDPHGNREFLRLIPAALGSAVFHVLLLVLLFLFGASAAADATTQTEKVDKNEDVVKVDPPEKPPEANDPFTTTDLDPARQEFDTDIKYRNERIEPDLSVPGLPDPSANVGILNGDKDNPPTSMPLPLGSGGLGQGGAIEGGLPGVLPNLGIGLPGGSSRGAPLAGTFFGRSGATKEYALRNGGGTGESEAAVTRGLRFIVMHQSADGHWALDGNFQDRGTSNDIAGTAFGLLPLLGAGHTHKPAPKNPYDKPIEKGLLFLMKKQDKRTGNFGGGMYAHGLATIAMCEAYGLSQDPNLRKPAQLAVKFIVEAQHKEGGGWRYSPGQAGDTSVVGWQVMALKSAQMAGLDVPEMTMRKAQRFLDSVCSSDEGYGYAGPGSTYTMSAVGLLCRQYLQAWGPKNKRMIDGINNHIKKHKPGSVRNMYFFYYATQVMHHFGGKDWEDWNVLMREHLIKTQDKSSGPLAGSWSSVGEGHGGAGGRLMTTSLSLLTLEVYYRHLPLYYRDPGEKMVAGN